MDNSRIKSAVRWSVIITFVSLFFFSQTVLAKGPGEWKTMWDSAKDDYLALTGKKKPKAEFKAFGKTFKKRSTGIDKALTKLDNTYNVMWKDNTQKNLKKYEDALAKFIEKGNGYKKVLKDIEGDKDANRTLIKTLSAIKAQGEAQVPLFQKKMEGAGTKEAMLAAAPKNLKATLKRAEKFISKVKAKPNPKAFNDDIGDAGRDVWMQLRFFVDAKDQMKDDPTPLYEALKPWGLKKVKVAKNANKNTIMDAIEVFDSKIQAISKWLKKEKI